jgi:predicted Zn-dependent protease
MREFQRVLASTLLGLVVTAVAGCGLLVDTEARYDRAQRAYSQGDYPAAIVDLKAVLQEAPDHIDARLLLGEALFRTRDIAGAETAFERAVELLRAASEAGPPGPGPRPNAESELLAAMGKLAALQLTLQDFAAARANAEFVINGNPADAGSYVVASQAAYYTGDNAAARSYASRLLDRSPGHPLAHAMLGFVSAREGSYPEAEEHFLAVLTRQPDQTAIRLALTQLQIVMGKSGAAVGTLAPVLVASPTDGRLHQLLDLMQLGSPEVRAQVDELANAIDAANAASPVPGMLRGRALVQAREYELAAAQFQTAMAKEGGRYPVIGYYFAQRGLGNADDARQALRRWVESNPADQSSGFLLASSYLEAGQNDLARAEYERLIGATEIDTPLVLNNLAWLYGEVNDPRAIETARQAHQLSPENGAITDTLGWLLVKAGQHDEGIRLLRLAAQQAPNSEEIRYHLATALTDVGDRDEVRRQIERILPGPLGVDGTTDAPLPAGTAPR